MPRWVHRDLPRSAPPDSWRSRRYARVPLVDHLDKSSHLSRRQRAADTPRTNRENCQPCIRSIVSGMFPVAHEMAPGSGSPSIMASGSPDGSTGASAETPIEQRVRLLVGQLQDQSAPSGIRYCRSEPVLPAGCAWCHNRAAKNQRFCESQSLWWSGNLITQQLVTPRFLPTLAALIPFWSKDVDLATRSPPIAGRAVRYSAEPDQTSNIGANG